MQIFDHNLCHVCTKLAEKKKVATQKQPTAQINNKSAGPFIAEVCRNIWLIKELSCISQLLHHEHFEVFQFKKQEINNKYLISKVFPPNQDTGIHRNCSAVLP